MNKETITNRQGICILIMYTLGSAIIFAPWRKAGKDSWIAILIAMVMIIPMVIVYTRLILIFPGKDLFDLQEKAFGKVAGKVTSFFFTLYAIYLGALIIRDFTEFFQVVNFPETPLYPFSMIVGVLCIWIVKAGIEVIGRWSTFVLPLAIITIIIVSLLLIPKMDFTNLLPILYNGINPVINGAVSAFAFPFAETFLFTVVFNSLRDKSKVLRLFILNIIIAGCFLMLTSIRNIMVLGELLNSRLYFPAHFAVSIINIKDFIDRIEVAVGGTFVVMGFVKLSVCLYTACIGLSKIFSIENYKEIAAPVGLMMVIVSIFIYKSTMEMFSWPADNYIYYIMPFAVILPLITLIFAEFKARSNAD